MRVIREKRLIAVGSVCRSFFQESQELIAYKLCFGWRLESFYVKPEGGEYDLDTLQRNGFYSCTHVPRKNSMIWHLAMLFNLSEQSTLLSIRSLRGRCIPPPVKYSQVPPPTILCVPEILLHLRSKLLLMEVAKQDGRKGRLEGLREIERIWSHWWSVAARGSSSRVHLATKDGDECRFIIFSFNYTHAIDLTGYSLLAIFVACVPVLLIWSAHSLPTTNSRFVACCMCVCYTEQSPQKLPGEWIWWCSLQLLANVSPWSVFLVHRVGWCLPLLYMTRSITQ